MYIKTIMLSILLFASPCLASTWVPELTIVFDKNYEFVTEIKTEHFNFHNDGNIPLDLIIKRVVASEVFLHYVLETRSTISSVPEPASIILLGSGLVSLVIIKRRRK